jgi:hypothetical protein
MLPKLRGVAWRLRWGAVALAIIVPLTFPAAASASGPSATAEATQYIYATVNPPGGTQAAEYDNSAYATSAYNWQRPFKFDFKLRVSNASLVTAKNYAEADASSCSRCGAVAIAFQVVLVSKQTLAKLTADDSALATADNCASCNTLAEAFQIVYATNQASAMSWVVGQRCEEVAFELRMLQYSGLSTNQIASRSTDLINQLISWLQSDSDAANSAGVPELVPAVNGANQLGALTSDNQPLVHLSSEIQH